MQAFELLWVRWLLIMTIAGLGLALALFLAFYLPSRPSRPRAEERFEEFAADIRVANRGIPLLLILLYVAIFVFIVVYTVYMSIAGLSY